jgi:hypothetical protein
VKFGYVKLPVEPTPASQEGVIYRPYIPLVVHGPKGSSTVVALVDTGADETILPAYVLTEIGGKYERDQQARFRGVGGQLVTVNYSQVELGVEHADGAYRWSAKIGFLDGRQVAILGTKGFLEHFNATFNADHRYLNLRPAQSFPGSQD